MQSASQIQLAQNTWDTCRSLLSPTLAANLSSCSGDPVQFNKGETDIIRLRVLPTLRQPVRFWSKKVCFYEIGVGSYEHETSEGLNLGGVSFVQFPNQKVCGGGNYRKQVWQILSQLASQRKIDFKVMNGDAVILYRHYSIKHRAFPCKLAGEDLAWLITESLPLFAAL